MDTCNLYKINTDLVGYGYEYQLYNGMWEAGKLTVDYMEIKNVMQIELITLRNNYIRALGVLATVHNIDI